MAAPPTPSRITLPPLVDVILWCSHILLSCLNEEHMLLSVQ